MDFFFPSPPFTQWQHGEVLWGLGANELTLQCWGRCSVTQEESENGAGRDALAHGESEGPLWPCHAAVRQTGPGVSCVSHSAKLNPSFKMTPQNGNLQVYSFPFCPLCFCWCQETAAKGGCREMMLSVGSATNQNGYVHQLHHEMSIYPHKGTHKESMDRSRYHTIFLYILSSRVSESWWKLLKIFTPPILFHVKKKKTWTIPAPSPWHGAFVIGCILSSRPAHIEHVAEWTSFFHPGICAYVERKYVTSAKLQTTVNILYANPGM